MSSRPLCYALFLALAFGATAGCKSSSAAGAPTTAAAPIGPKVDGPTAKKLVAGGARLLDVRGADEFATNHIDGAENAPVETIEDQDFGAKDTQLILYCRSGSRSARAAAALRAKGFTRVYELGAMSNWDKK